MYLQIVYTTYGHVTFGISEVGYVPGVKDLPTVLRDPGLTPGGDLLGAMAHW